MKPLREQEAALEKRAATRALKKHDGCITHAARALGLCKRQMYRLVARHNLQELLRGHPGAPLRGNKAWRELGAM